MTQPINLQVNVLAGIEMPQRVQEGKNIESHQQLGQAVDAEKESDNRRDTVQTDAEAQNSELNKDGSGRGRAFARRRKKGGKEVEGEKEKKALPDDFDPAKGKMLDVLR